MRRASRSSSTTSTVNSSTGNAWLAADMCETGYLIVASAGVASNIVAGTYNGAARTSLPFAATVIEWPLFKQPDGDQTIDGIVLGQQNARKAGKTVCFAGSAGARSGQDVRLWNASSTASLFVL